MIAVTPLALVALFTWIAISQSQTFTTAPTSRLLRSIPRRFVSHSTRPGRSILKPQSSIRSPPYSPCRPQTLTRKQHDAIAYILSRTSFQRQILHSHAPNVRDLNTRHAKIQSAVHFLISSTRGPWVDDLIDVSVSMARKINVLQRKRGSREYWRLLEESYRVLSHILAPPLRTSMSSAQDRASKDVRFSRDVEARTIPNLDDELDVYVGEKVGNDWIVGLTDDRKCTAEKWVSEEP